MRIRTIYSALISAVLLYAAAAYAVDFSADMIMSSRQSSMTAKLYVSDQKSRMEMPGTITISRIDKKVMWMLMPEQRMYMEHPLDMHTAMSTQEKVDGEIERKAEGKETVNGMSTTKYRVTIETGGRREMVFQWIDDVNHFPVKTAAIDGSWWSEFKNIKATPQDPALFEIPSGYNKMSFNMPDMSGAMKNSE